MTHNVLTALNRLAMAEEWLNARPKRDPFQIFCSPGILVAHTRKVWLRVRQLRDQLTESAATLRLLPILLRT